MKKNNAWNIRRLLNKSFVPVTQRTSVLYFRLSDFKSSIFVLQIICHNDEMSLSLTLLDCLQMYSDGFIQFWHFLRPWRYVNSQNIAISFDYSTYFQ